MSFYIVGITIYESWCIFLIDKELKKYYCWSLYNNELEPNIFKLTLN